MPRRFILALSAALLAALSLQTSAQQTAPQGFLQQFEWDSDDALFGGLSALHMSADGLRITVISDRGAFSTGDVQRGDMGQILDINLAPFALLRAKGAGPLTAGRNDSEGLAVAQDGTVYISFEGAARVLRYTAIDGPAENLPGHPDFAGFQPNSALEALAIDAQGTLYAIPERSGAMDRAFPIYRFQNGVWDIPFSLPRVDEFLPVSADFGPDGRLYVLMRQFHGFSGFSSKLIRMDISAATVSAPEVMFQSPVGFHDNLEGLSIWRDGAGQLRASMVADDNFLPFLSSGIVEYHLPE